MGAGERRKGQRGEREAARALRGARKISRSGYTGADLIWRDRHVEVKRREHGFRLLYRWLRDAPIVMHRADRQPWLVTMETDELLDLLDEAAARVSYGDGA